MSPANFCIDLALFVPVYVKDNLRVTYYLEEIGIVMHGTTFVWSY